MALETWSPTILRFGTFEVDLRAVEVRKQGVKIKVQEQPFQVLAAYCKPELLIPEVKSISIFGAGDGNRTHVKSLGSLRYNSQTRWIGGFFAIFGTP